MAVTFIDGICLVGMEVNLEDFANYVGIPLEQASWALIFKSGGGCLGAILAGLFLSNFHPLSMMLVCLFVVAFLLVSACYITTVPGLFTLYFMIGMLTVLNESSISLEVRRTFGIDAGPWLQSVAFSVQLGFLVFPIFAAFFTVKVSYILAFFLTVVVIGLVAIAKIVSEFRTDDEQNTQTETIAPANGISLADVMISLIGFLVTGIICSTGTYMRKFIDIADTDNLINDSGGINPFIIIPWFQFMMLMSRMLAVKLQQHASTTCVITLFLLFCAGATGSCVLPVLNPESLKCIWAGFLMMGFFWGPLTGLMNDLWNRFTEPTAYGTALVNFMGFAGSGLYSLAMYAVWVDLNYPDTLFWADILGYILCVMLVGILTCLHASSFHIKDTRGKKAASSERGEATDEEAMTLLSGVEGDESPDSENESKQN